MIRRKINSPASVSDKQPFTVFTEDMEPYDEGRYQKNGRYFTNLRPGIYIMDEQVRISKPHKFKGVKVPPRKRFKNSSVLQIEYRDQPGPGMVNWKEGKIYLDNRLKTAPRNVRDFVIYHELGHARFKDELSCDLYAADKLFKKGDSPSKVAEAAELFRPNSPITQQLKSKVYED